MEAERKTAEGKPAGGWWLRSPGLIQNCTAHVLADGSLGYSSVLEKGIAVRPAMWVELDEQNA